MTPPPTSLSFTSRGLDNLGELIASLPVLIGFPPVDSVVLLTFADSDRTQLGMMVRADLPAPRHGPDLADQLCLSVLHNDPEQVVCVIVGGGTADPPDLPYHWLVRYLERRAEELGLPLTHAAWVPAIRRDATWWCYEDVECTGRVRDPETTALAVERAIAGDVTYSSRVEMADLLAPDPEDQVAHRAQLLAAAEGDEADPLDLWHDVRAAIEAAAEHDEMPELTDDQIVRLTAALFSPLVRDNCIATVLTDQADAAERLWTVLTRATPAPERAEPASLLALHVYLRGDGVFAGIALDVALDADSNHPLASLLREAISHGTPPAVVRQLVTDSVASAVVITKTEKGES